MKKRILAMLLAMCMIVGLLPVVAMAEEATTQPPVTFNYMVKGSSKSIVVNAGDKPQYWITTNNDAAHPDYYYMAESNADNWNIKMEYPVGGIPTITLKDAKVVEQDSWLLQLVGSGAYTSTKTAFDGDVKVILEGSSYASFKSTRPAMLFNVTGTATIAGPGSITIKHSLSSNSAGVIHCDNGNLVFDHANVDITIPSEYYRSGHGIVAKGGDITVKGGSLKLDGHNKYPSSVTIDGVTYTWSHYRPTVFVLWATKKADGTAGGSLIIEDGANVELFGSSSNNTISGYEQAQSMIRLEDTLTISNSDVVLAAAGGTYLPVFDTAQVPNVVLNFTNGYAVTRSASKAAYNATTKTVDIPSNAVTKTDIAEVTLGGSGYLKVAHACIPGEPVYEGGEVCSTLKDKVTYCTVCDKEVTREQVTVTPDQIHTPGEAEIISVVKAAWSDELGTYAPGTYKTETKCTVCGEVAETADVPFSAAWFYYSTYGNTGGIGETATGTKAKLLLNPGETKYYTTVKTTATDYPDAWYMAAGSADNWNMKFEYPVGGTPVLTLKGATIKNDAGLHYGVGAHRPSVPLTIVVEEDSEIVSRSAVGESIGKYPTYNRALSFWTTAAVTITGPGKLYVSSDNHADDSANILAFGDLIFDGADVELWTNANTWPSNDAIRTKDGNITIKNTKLAIYGVDVTEDGAATAYHAALRADSADGTRGNITICDGSNVTAITSNVTNKFVTVAGQFTIKDSNVEMATTGHTYTSLFNTASKPVLEFTKDYVVKAYSGNVAIYDAQTNTVTAPDKGLIDFATNAGTDLYYFVVQMTGEIAGTSVTLGNTLDVNFAFDETIVSEDGYAEFVKGDGETVKVSLADCATSGGYYVLTFPGVAAKEMKEAIKVTIYNAKGEAVSETYTDSIEDYALRMLRGEKPGNHTEDQFDAMKTLLVDMLNYGAAAQTFFGYNTDTLVNATLSDAEKALATTTVESWTEELRTATGEGYLGTSFVLESDIAMLIALDKAVTGEGSYALVTFTDHYGNVTTDKRVDAVDTYDTHTQYRFDGLVAADGCLDVVWKFYAADGTELLTVTDSLEKYVARTMEKHAWMEQIMIYCNSAYAYLHFGETNA